MSDWSILRDSDGRVRAIGPIVADLFLEDTGFGPLKETAVLRETEAGAIERLSQILREHETRSAAQRRIDRFINSDNDQ